MFRTNAKGAAASMSSNNRHNPTTAPSSSPAISRSAWITLLVISSVGLIPMYGETVIIPAIPDFIKEFGITYTTSSWILAAFLIAGAVMTPIAGKLSDIYGKKKIVLIIMCIYTIGVALGGFASNISFMIFARILQGIGISMFPIAFGMLKLQFPKEKLSIAQGIFTGVFTAGSAIGLALGGTIIYHYGWHFALLSMVPAAIILILIVRKFIHIKEEEEKKQQQLQQQPQKQSKVQKSKLGTEYCCVFTKIGNEQEYFHHHHNSAADLSMHDDKNNNNLLQKIDIKGAITLSVTIISFLMALSYLENIHSLTMSDFMPSVILSIVSIVSLTLFIIVERKISAKVKAAKKIPTSSLPSSSSSMVAPYSPLIDLNLLANRIILLNNISLMILGITMFMVYQSISVLVRSPMPLGFGGNAISAANVQIPFTIIILVVSVSAGIIISKFGNVNPSLVGTIITTFGFFSLFLFHSSELLISANLAVIAIGLTLTRVGNWNILLEYTPKDSIGISLGMTAMLFFVGMAIGPAIAGIYLQSNQMSILGSSLSFPSLQSYNMIFITAFFISVISIALMLVLKKKMSNQGE
ncbi:MAG: MFS transporter [Candidatus Nitrosopolaris sp.]